MLYNQHQRYILNNYPTTLMAEGLRFNIECRKLGREIIKSLNHKLHLK
jgi:hypothetical protein